jgi:hypothetical protein
MAFHISNLGFAGSIVRRFADLEGYVPQFGDKPHQFRWCDNWTPEEEEWKGFVEQAEAAAQTAEVQIAKWQQNSHFA